MKRMFPLHKCTSALTAALLALGVACGDSQADGNDRNDDAPDAQVEAIATFNGCADKDYVDRSGEHDSRVIEVGANGLNFSPKCVIIAAGQSLTWQGSLSAHPFAPGNPSDEEAGSLDSPILARSSGRSAEFTFASAGTFPYYCAVHAFGAGQGMAGSVHVR
jgi:plastocyanin